MALFSQLTARQGWVQEDREGRSEVLAGQTLFGARDGVSEIFLQVRQAGLSGDAVETRRPRIRCNDA